MSSQHTLVSTRPPASRKSAAATSTFPFIRIDERTSLFYKDWPPAPHAKHTGKTILFVHGWALNSDMRQYQMLPLADCGVRTIAFDRRGHGRSTDPGCGYDIDTLADDLAAVIEHLDLHRLILVGHSMGGAEIVRYLSRHGSARVEKILLVAPTLPFLRKTADNPDGFDDAILQAVRTQLSTDLPQWLAENAPPFFRPETTPGIVDWGVRMCQQASLKALLETNVADTETDFRPDLKAITTPTLIIHGDSDASAPLDTTARRTAQLIPGSQLKVYADGPHGLFVTHREKLNRDLLAFINE